MEQYIKKSALVAEIARLRQKVMGVRTDFADGQKSVLTELLSFLDTLEVKEVDLEKEIEKYLRTFSSSPDNGIEYSKKLARYFFELGLSASNPITATDRGTAEEIIVNLKRVEQDYHINLTREMEWLRNKVKKGEEV